MRKLRPTLTLITLCLAGSLLGCDNKDTPKEPQTYVQSIAASNTPEEKATFFNAVNGVEIKVTYYYKGDVVLRQDVDNKMTYASAGVSNKEEAQRRFEQISNAYKNTAGVTETINYQDDYVTENITVDYTKANISELCKLPGTSLTDCNAQYLSMLLSEKMVLKQGFKKQE
jgi:uncharacterized lipoprotein YehR (DUF1307 family)